MSKETPEMLRERVAVVALGLGCAVLLAVVLYQTGPAASWLPDCLFHRFTGFDCPGCGMTRAAHATLHGRIAEAFRFNPVGMLLFPLAMLGIGLELAGWVRGKPLPFRFRAGGRMAWIILGVLMVFWVLRNVPVWPFTGLAPQ